MKKIPWKTVAIAALILTVMVAIRCVVTAGRVMYEGGTNWSDRILADPWFYVGIAAAIIGVVACVIKLSEPAAKNESDEEEVDNRIYKCAPVNVKGICKVNGTVLKSCRLAKEGINLAERTLSENKSEQPVDYRLEHKVRKAVYNSGKRATDDNTDSHIYNVAAGYEGFKFTKKLFHNASVCNFLKIHFYFSTSFEIFQYISTISRYFIFLIYFFTFALEKDKYIL